MAVFSAGFLVVNKFNWVAVFRRLKVKSRTLVYSELIAPDVADLFYLTNERDAVVIRHHLWLSDMGYA